MSNYKGLLQKNWLQYDLVQQDMTKESGDSPKKEIDKFKAQMEEKFKMSDLGLLAYYLGIEVTQTEALPEEQLLQITKHKTAKAIWDALKTRHIGEERVQQARLQTLKSDFEMLHMKEDETIDTFTAKLTTLVHDPRDRYLQIVASIEQYSDLSEMTLEEAIGRLKTYEERIKYKRGRKSSATIKSENLDGGVTESMSRPRIKEDIYAARTPIGRQSVGSITNQKHDQSGFMIDHNSSKGGSNQKNMINLDLRKITAVKVEVTERRKIDLPGCKDDHKHYKKSKH
ncbi:hypothetical protein Tco_1322360 [Tanacetum coccineum]